MYFFLVNIGKVKCFIIFLKTTLSGDRFNIFFLNVGSLKINNIPPVPDNLY